MDAEGAALLDRRVKEVLSEAVVLTEADVRETLRAHMVDLRSSFAELRSRLAPGSCRLFRWEALSSSWSGGTDSCSTRWQCARRKAPTWP